MGFQLNIYNLPVFLAALLNAGLAIFVFTQRRRTPMHRAFVAWNLALAIWNFGAVGIYGATSAAGAMAWSRLCYHGIVFIPATFLQLILTLRDRAHPWQYRLVHCEYLLGALLLAGNYWHPGFLDGRVLPRFWGYGPIGGPGTLILDPLLIGTSLYALFLLWRQIRDTDGIRRNQLLYIYWGSVIAFIGGGVNVLVIHGANIYPFGNITNIFYSLAMGYAIASYSWMDIRIVVGRGVIYGLLGGALAGTYLASVYFLEQTLQTHELLWKWELRFVLLSPIFFFWSWLKGRVKNAVEAYFWPGAKTYRRQLRELGTTFSSCLEIEKIAATAVQQIPHLLGSTGAAFFLLDMPGNQWRLVAASGAVQPAQDIHLDHLRPGWFQGFCEQDVVTEELDWRLKTDPSMPSQVSGLLDWLQQQQVTVSLPVRFQKQLMGLLILGDSIKGQLIEPRSIRATLRDLSSQMALGTHNAMAVLKIEEEHDQLVKDREIAAIGTIVTEMAHELTKPLTNIMNEGSRLSSAIHGTSQSSVSKIEKEVQRATEILDGFALLSPTRTLHKIPMLLQDLLEETLTSLGVEEDAGIRVVRNYGTFPAVHINPGQIVQVFTNVIQNAWQAMGQGGALTLTLDASHVHDQSVIRVVIEDTGPGIPLEIRNKLFEPFFTTKKAQGGRGVGLTIAKAMVERHNGRIAIESPITTQGGTRVSISLPVEKSDNFA